MSRRYFPKTWPNWAHCWDNRLSNWRISIRLTRIDHPIRQPFRLHGNVGVCWPVWPPFWLSLLPIVLPVILIGGHTVLKRFGDSLNPDVLRVTSILGDKNIALGISAAIALAMLVQQKRTNLQALSDSVQSVA